MYVIFCDGPDCWKDSRNSDDIKSYSVWTKRPADGDGPIGKRVASFHLCGVCRVEIHKG